MHATRSVALFAALATSSALVAYAQHNNNTIRGRAPVVDVLDERGWTDVSFGLMLEHRDLPPSLVRRAHPETRDLADGQQDVEVRFDERGNMMLPRGVARRALGLVKRGASSVVPQQGKRMKRHPLSSKREKRSSSKKRKSKKSKKAQVKADVTSLISSTASSIGKAFAAKITWYTGHDLLAPSCVTHSKWAPTDKSMIAAVTINWAGKPACGSYLQLRPKNGKKAIIVRIVDSCAGCAAGTAHVDLTIAAFSSLYNLDIGLVNGIQVQVISDPVKKYTSQAIALYGPQKL